MSGFLGTNCHGKGGVRLLKVRKRWLRVTNRCPKFILLCLEKFMYEFAGFLEDFKSGGA
jgi:hypothetical protein